MPPTLLLLACVRDDGSGSGNTYTGPGPSYIDTAVSHDTDTDSDSDTDSDTDADADTDTDTDTDADTDADTDTGPDTAIILESGCLPDTAVTTERDTAVVIDTASDGSRDWIGVYADTFTTCGLGTDGAVQCWGTAAEGNDTDPPGGTFVSMAINKDPEWPVDQHACGIRGDGSIECWGLNDEGQTDAPEGTFTQVVVGDAASCALGVDGTISCWGNSRSYSGSSWAQIAMGGGEFAAIDTSGRLFVWVWYDGPYSVYQIAGTFTTVSAFTGVCATATNGAVTCWHWTGCGGTGPAPSGALSSVCRTSNYYACGLNASGYPVCWSNFTDVPGILEEPARPFTSLSCGFNYVCGVALNGAIICWGPEEDTYGNLTAP